MLAYESDKWFGTSLKYMPSSFFKKSGFKEVSRDGTRVLLHLDLGARKSSMLVFPKKRVIGEKGETVMDVFCNSQYPWCGRMVDKIRRSMRKKLNMINTDRRDFIEQFGVARGIFINGEPVIKRMTSWKEIKSALNKFTNRNVDG